MPLLRPTRRPQGPPLFRFDAGWLYVIAGAALLGATVLLPAIDDLTDAEARRDRALALEAARAQRLTNHTGYLQALQAADETLLLHLAATQLNQIPADRDVLLAPDVGPTSDASPFRRLDAPYHAPEGRRAPSSLLHRLATDDATRLWLLAGGALSILYGLLPLSSHAAAPRAAATRPPRLAT